MLSALKWQRKKKQQQHRPYIEEKEKINYSLSAGSVDPLRGKQGLGT